MQREKLDSVNQGRHTVMVTDYSSPVVFLSYMAVLFHIALPKAGFKWQEVPITLADGVLGLLLLIILTRQRRIITGPKLLSRCKWFVGYETQYTEGRLQRLVSRLSGTRVVRFYGHKLEPT